MSDSEKRFDWRRARGALLCSALAGFIQITEPGCVPKDACLRHSDCAKGQSCDDGECKLPPMPFDAALPGAGGASGKGGATSRGGAASTGGASSAGGASNTDDASSTGGTATDDVDGALTSLPDR